jgi:hypothetical protein
MVALFRVRLCFLCLGEKGRRVEDGEVMMAV